MKAFTACAIIAASAAAGVRAIPAAHGSHAEAHHNIHKRAVVWVTEIDVDTVTVPVTATVWVDGNDRKHHPVTTVLSTATVHPIGYSDSSSSSSSSTSTTSTTSEAAPVNTETAPTYTAPAATTTTTSQASAYQPSTNQQPTTTTTPSVYVPTTTAVSPTTTTTQAAPTQTGSSSGGDNDDNPEYPCTSGSQYSGDFTYYGSGVGACGFNVEEGSHMVAISYEIWDYHLKLSGATNPNNNPLCNMKLKITGSDGNTYDATIADRCPGCVPGALDFMEGYFNTVTNGYATAGVPADGRAHNMKWEFA